MECKEVFERLQEEQAKLEQSINALRDSAENAKGGVREYRRTRLMQMLAVYHDLQQRANALEQHAVNGLEKLVFEAEKLWKDFRNAATSAQVSTGTRA